MLASGVKINVYILMDDTDDAFASASKRKLMIRGVKLVKNIICYLKKFTLPCSFSEKTVH